MWQSILIYILSASILFSQNNQYDALKQHFFNPDISSLSVSDWYNPTASDYKMIQQFLRAKIQTIANSPLSTRPFSSAFLNEEFHGWITYRMNCKELVGYEENVASPGPHIIYFNSNPNDKKKCIITYGSYPCQSEGRDYAKGIDYMIQSLKNQKFKGHLIYYIGGWPGLKKGRLKFADVPYSFKPFLFEEVRDLGYETVLWLDTCCIPVKHLKPIFRFIKKNGLCFHGDFAKMPWNDFNKAYKLIMPSLNLNKTYKKCVSQIIGIHFKDPRGRLLIDKWIEAAEKKVPFLQSDEPPFIFLVNDLNLLHGRLPPKYYVTTACNTGNFSYKKHNPKAIIYHQYDFLNPSYKAPLKLFDELLSKK